MKAFETEKKKPAKKDVRPVPAPLNDAATAMAASGEDRIANYLATRRDPPQDPRPGAQPEDVLEHWLAVLDEFDREKENPTLYDSMELDPAWLTMKDTRLQAASTPVTHAGADPDALSVPDEVFPLVRDLQMAIGCLAQSATGAWIGTLERRTATT